MEISINFLVMIIISLVIFIFGLIFAFRFFGQATSYQKQVDQNTRKEIENIIINQGNRVAAYPTTISLLPGKDDIVGLGIFSIGFNDSAVFSMSANCVKYINTQDMEEDSTLPNTCPKITILYTPPSVTIKPNSDFVYAIYIKNTGAWPGLYVINARVVTGTQQYGDIQKIYVRTR